MMTRRQAIKTTALASAALATLPGAIAQPTPGNPVPILISTAPQPFKLPPLPYAYDALEPHIDARTMEIHHDKHHAAYVANLNKAVADYPDLGKKSIEELMMDLNEVPEKIRIAVRNQGGGHYNHSLFWQMMKKDAAASPPVIWPKPLIPASAALGRSRIRCPKPRSDNLAAAGPGSFSMASS